MSFVRGGRVWFDAWLFEGFSGPNGDEDGRRRPATGFLE